MPGAIQQLIAGFDQVVGRQHVFDFRRLGEEMAAPAQDFVRRENHPSVGLAHDAHQPRQHAVEPERIGRINGHGDYARVQAGIERHDVVQAWIIDQQRTVRQPVHGLATELPGP